MQFTLTKFVLLSLLFPSSSFNEAEDVKTFLKNFDEEGQNKFKQHLTEVQALFQRFVKSTKEAVINSPLQGWMVQKVNESLKYGKPTDENDAKAIRNIRSKAMVLQEKDWKELKNVSLEMFEVYRGKICAKRDATGHCVDQWELYPTLRRNFANARDEAELRRYWEEWYHVKTNDTVILNNFERMVKLYHNGSVSMNYTDIVSRWEDQYRSDVFLDFSLEKWANESFFKLLPLYEELHAYVKYQVDKTSDKLAIAAHLVGDLFAESWQNIYLTHGSNLKLNYTAKLKEKFEIQKNMLESCVKYFNEIGFNTDSVCTNDIKCDVLKKEEEICRICRPTTLIYPSDEDEDWMSMCAEVAMDDLNDMFVFVGRLVYSNYYKKKGNPVYFRDAANPGMFDSLGKAVALAFNSPSNLNKSGLINIRVVDDELRFEHLYKLALITIPSMMHAFAVDTWLRRFLRDVRPMKKFNWTILNDNWWQTLENYTGISRPSFEHDYRSVDFLQVPRIAILEPIGREFFSTAVSYQLFELFCNSTEPKERTNFDQCYINDIGENIEEVKDFLSKAGEWTTFGLKK
ncbi:Peptidase M2 domain containing protein [Trichuris trichiura]|uniref:Angiotensin-converting enzyme n=1 Tax=Trichuris trichiura TaxID=36087 RepID=A0A077YXE5_TRITR|nr:Peptidase M2 domain containing protein [Trichuris trichiura]